MPFPFSSGSPGPGPSSGSGSGSRVSPFQRRQGGGGSVSGSPNATSASPSPVSSRPRDSGSPTVMRGNPSDEYGSSDSSPPMRTSQSSTPTPTPTTTKLRQSFVSRPPTDDGLQNDRTLVQPPHYGPEARGLPVQHTRTRDSTSLSSREERMGSAGSANSPKISARRSMFESTDQEPAARGSPGRRGSDNNNNNNSSNSSSGSPRHTPTPATSPSLAGPAPVSIDQARRNFSMSSRSVSAGVNTAIAKLPPSQLREMRDAFQVLDRDNDGLIDAEDIAVMLETLGMNPASVTSFFLSGQSQTVNLPTFLTSIASLLEPLSSSQELFNALSAFDEDDSGQIDLDELREALFQTQPPAADGSSPEPLSGQQIDEVVSGFTARRTFSKGAMAKSTPVSFAGRGASRKEVFRYQDFVNSVRGAISGEEEQRAV